jgi:hypothetical protein
MAGVKGLEPSAFAVTGRRCNQLNYTPALKSLGVNKRVDEKEVVDMTNKVNADSKKINSFLMTLSKLKPRALS